jgi:exodeoxyribonuclease VII small subunit
MYMQTMDKGRRGTAAEPEQDYETLMRRLTTVVDRLEAGELPLAEALALYEEGVVLGVACQRLLDAAELRVRELSTTEEDSDEA